MTEGSEPTGGRPAVEDDVTSRIAMPAGAVGLDPAIAAAKPPVRRGRVRWALAAAVVALVVVATVGVTLLITGRDATSTVIRYVPADSIAYGEIRLDLPGDQRRTVGEFLSKFPGFKDQAALDPKIDEILDQLVKDATNGSQTYTADVKPWFDGQLGLSVGALPPASALTGGDAAAAASVRALALVSVKDPVVAQAWFDKAIATSGATATSEVYGGTKLTVIDEGSGPLAAVAIADGKVAVLGDIASVKAALDTRGDGRFAAQPGPKAAIESATGDDIGFVYVGLRSVVDWTARIGASVPRPSGLPTSPIGTSILKTLPDWGAYRLRVEGDAVVLDAVAPKPQTLVGPTANRASNVLAHIPAAAVLAVTTNDFGASLKGYLDLYRSEPAYKPVLDQVDQALGLVGGADAAFGWAGDTAVVVDVADGTPEGGLIVSTTDQAAAEHLFTSLRSVIGLAGTQVGATVRDEAYNGTTVTIVDLGDLRERVGGAASGMPTRFPLPAGHIEIAYAIHDGTLVIGSGPAFVKHVLDTTAATSLGSVDRYKSLADRAGTGTGTTFVDVSAIRALLEKGLAGSADPATLAKYEQDIKPFLTPFDALIASNSVSGEMTRSVIYLTVR